VYYEELQTANMVRNHHLAKSISDAGWSAFLTILAFKAAYAGKRAIAAPPADTSQDCSGVLPDGSLCSKRIQKALSVRAHVRPRCGLVLDRDANAALNILALGKKESGAGRAPQALAQPGGAYVAREAPGFSRGEHVTVSADQTS